MLTGHVKRGGGRLCSAPELGVANGRGCGDLGDATGKPLLLPDDEEEGRDKVWKDGRVGGVKNG